MSFVGTSSRRSFPFLLALLSACSTQPKIIPPVVEIEVPQVHVPAVSTPVPQQAEVRELPSQDIVEPITAPVVPVSPSVVDSYQRSEAVVALLDSADQSQQQGDLSSAQRTLQRAQRIAPQDPAVYYRLATTHRDLNDYRLAEQVALKGISIVQGQADKLRKFWLLVADIRLKAGNISGADQAEVKANQ